MCNCKNKSIVATADLGGKFNCMICGKLQTGVSSIGHGVVCHECQKKGHCKWCGELDPKRQLQEEIEKRAYD